MGVDGAHGFACGGLVGEQVRRGAGQGGKTVSLILLLSQALITLALCALALKMDMVLPFSLSNGIQTILVIFAAPCH